MKNFTHEGRTVTVLAPADVLSDDVVVVGSIVGVANFSALATEEVEIDRLGVFTLPKVTTDVIAQGDKLYWDAGAGKLTKTAGTGSKPFVGLAESAAGNGITTVSAILTGTSTTGPA